MRTNFNLSDDSLKDVLKILIRAGGKTKSNEPKPNWSWQRTKGTPEHLHNNPRLEYYLKGLREGGRKGTMEIYDKAQREVREESEKEE